MTLSTLYKPFHRLVNTLAHPRNALTVHKPHNCGVPHTSQSTAPLGLTVAAVARQLGVAPATLRTWDRRYGLGPTEHASGAHRRYTAADLARLEHMRRLVIAGVPPADAAREANAGSVQAATDSEEPANLLRPDGARWNRARPALEGRAGGGRVVALPGATPAVRGLARAAVSLDGHACSGIVDDNIARHGVIWTWDHLIVPVLIGVGERWENSGSGIEIEHLLSASIGASLSATARSLQEPVSSRAVLLACAPDELHVLPLMATAAALAEEGVSARMLGDRLPLSALEEAVRRTGPAAVLVWAQLPGSAAAADLARLPNYRPTPTILIGGPGWFGDVPTGISRVSSLQDAVERIAHSVGA